MTMVELHRMPPPGPSQPLVSVIFGCQLVSIPFLDKLWNICSNLSSNAVIATSVEQCTEEARSKINCRARFFCVYNISSYPLTLMLAVLHLLLKMNRDTPGS